MGRLGPPARRWQAGAPQPWPGGKCCVARVPRCKGEWRAWIKAQKPVGSPGKSGLVRTGIGLWTSRAGGTALASSFRECRQGGEAILRHTGAGPEPGRAPHPHLVRKAGFSVGVGPKGHPWQGREMSRPPRLRENIADVKKLSSRRAGAKGSKCPSVWSEGSPWQEPTSYPERRG